MILTEKALRQFARSLLFETEKSINITEMFQPDDMQPQQHINYGGHFHQPGPDPESDKKKIEEFLDDSPVKPTVTVGATQVAYSVPAEVISNPEENVPTNNKQLALTVGATLDNMDLSNKDIEKVWIGINKILDSINEEK